MENATPPTPKGRVSVAKITMIFQNDTGKNKGLTDAEICV